MGSRTGKERAGQAGAGPREGAKAAKQGIKPCALTGRQNLIAMSFPTTVLFSPHFHPPSQPFQVRQRTPAECAQVDECGRGFCRLWRKPKRLEIVPRSEPACDKLLRSPRCGDKTENSLVFAGPRC